MKHILVPTDFSESAKNALQFAIETAKIIPSKITLLHSFEVFDEVYIDYMGMSPSMSINQEINFQIIEDLKKRLEMLKQELEKEHAIEFCTEVLNLPLAAAVEELAEEQKIDLIIMGTLGATGLDEKIWGSRTASVIGNAPVPVLAIPGNFKWKKPEQFLLATSNFEKDKNILNFLFEWADLYLAQIHTCIFTSEEWSTAKFVEQETKLNEYSAYLKSEYSESELTPNHIHGTSFEESIQKFIQEKTIDVLVMITYQHGFWKSLFNPSKTKQMSFHLNVPLLAIPASLGKE